MRARLTREINYWDARAARLREEERAGKEQRINAQNAEAMASRLVERMHKRQSELDRERQIAAMPPVLKGAALIIPGGLLRARMAEPPTTVNFVAEDPFTRAESERISMESVMATERALICPPLSGPETMIVWTTKGTTDAIQEAQAGRDHRQAA